MIKIISDEEHANRIKKEESGKWVAVPYFEIDCLHKQCLTGNEINRILPYLNASWLEKVLDDIGVKEDSLLRKGCRKRHKEKLASIGALDISDGRRIPVTLEYVVNISMTRTQSELILPNSILRICQANFYETDFEYGRVEFVKDKKLVKYLRPYIYSSKRKLRQVALCEPEVIKTKDELISEGDDLEKVLKNLKIQPDLVAVHRINCEFWEDVKGFIKIKTNIHELSK